LPKYAAAAASSVYRPSGDVPQSTAIAIGDTNMPTITIGIEMGSIAMRVVNFLVFFIILIG